MRIAALVFWLCVLPLGALAATSSLPETQEGQLDAKGVVRFLYGEGTPTLRCSPLHVCSLMLESGETIYDTVAGDTVRWQIVHGTAGRNAAIPTLYFKPLDNAIPETNLIITTSRRTYEVSLVAMVYVDHRMYGFKYPQPVTQATPRPSALSSSAAVNDVGPSGYDYHYRFSGASQLRPLLACSDGTHTWLLMPALHDDPSVYVVEANGAQSLTNVFRNGNWYRLSGVPSRILIVAGPSEGGVQATVEHVGG